MTAPDIPLKEHLDQEVSHTQANLTRYERYHAEMHVALQRAIDKGEEQQTEMVTIALDSINKRLEGMNEFRKSLEDVTRDAVSRDLFDIVTNRVTVIENTYVQKADYTKDTDGLRDRYIADLAQRDVRLTTLEANTVRSEALQGVSDEATRTRKTLMYTIVAGAVLTVINLLINVIQSAPG